MSRTETTLFSIQGELNRLHYQECMDLASCAPKINLEDEHVKELLRHSDDPVRTLESLLPYNNFVCLFTAMDLPIPDDGMDYHPTLSMLQTAQNHSHWEAFIAANRETINEVRELSKLKEFHWGSLFRAHKDLMKMRMDTEADLLEEACNHAYGLVGIQAYYDFELRPKLVELHAIMLESGFSRDWLNELNM